MRVLILALGASRRLAATEQSRALAASGANAAVLVDRVETWPADSFAAGVEVISAADLTPNRLIHKVIRRSRRLLGHPVSPDRPWDQLLLRYGRFDALVVTDPLSFPAAARLADRLGPTTRIAARADQLRAEPA